MSKLSPNYGESGSSDAPGSLGRIGSARSGCGARNIAQTSPEGAGRVLIRVLETAATLSTLAERGRVVPEIGEPTLRELFVYDYRLMYQVRGDRVVIRAFLHGARDFSKWRREQAPEL
jgi:plasmid stabilization system protein ParE